MNEPHEAGPDAPFPWPPPDGEPPLAALFRTWRESVLGPSRFFRAMPTTGSILPALLYYLIVGIVAAAFSLYWSTVFRAIGFSSNKAASALDAWSPLLGFLLAPLFLILGLVITFAVVHLMLLVLGGAKRGAGTTFRVLCFAYGPYVFAVVPGLGAPVAFIWTIVLAVIGLREAHRTDGWRAGLAVLLPFVLLFALIVFGIVMAVLTLAQFW